MYNYWVNPTRKLITLGKLATRPRSQNEDLARSEFIFNVLVLGALALLLIAILDDLVHRVTTDPTIHSTNSLSSMVLYILFGFFALLYTLSQTRHARIASYLLLSAFFALAAYMGFRWGVDLSASLLFYALVIIMAGILISTRVAFISALLIGGTIGLTVYLQNTDAVVPNRTWIQQSWGTDDVIIATVIFLVIAMVMWLSNREIEKSLRRARRSEKELRMERDSLEVRVQQRSEEIQRIEMERMSQAYKFIEFGRMASGIFHDLMNPLTGLSMNIDSIAEDQAVEPIKENVSRAKVAASHMQDLLSNMRKHLAHEGSSENFSVRERLESVLYMLETTAKQKGITCSLVAHTDATLFGDPVAFAQIFTNLISNAIQSFLSQSPADSKREIQVILKIRDYKIEIWVKDNGGGIAEESLQKIFEPFFTTRREGVGLGLSLTKRIVEHEFGGSIEVVSKIGQGTTFNISIPLTRK